MQVYRPVWMLKPLQLKKNRPLTTVVLFHCCTLIWSLTNNNYNPYLLQFLTVSFNIRTFVLYLHSLAIYSWTVEQIGKDMFFSAEDYTNMNYYNLCGINSKHSNISNKGGGVYILKITIKLYVTPNDDIFLIFHN